ncbi:hypothetical protein TrVFT333_010955 [Trichoderma virens FT-333]|nr:hypothetical protein TrVFT333_010955 [Trichoderma virens FT-333]
MPSSAVQKRVLRSNTRRAPSPFPPPDETSSSVLSLPPLHPPSPPLLPPSPLSDAEVYLDEVKEMFGRYGAEGTSFGEVLLSLVDCSEETRDEIIEFIGNAIDRAPHGHRDGSVAPEGEWASWDPAMDSDWERFVSELQAAGLNDKQVRQLSKPSGPRDALLCCLWHYPTYSTLRQDYGQTLDSTNRSIQVQCDKILDHTNVRTHDTYPIRTTYNIQGPQYERLLGNKSRKILDICEDFAFEAVKIAPFTICLGGHNSEFLQTRLQDAEGLSVEKYDIQTSITMYDRIPSCLVIRNDDRIIVNMIFFSYHGMYFNMNKEYDREVVLLHDLIWNGVCEWGRVPVARERHFANAGSKVVRRPTLNSLKLCFKYRRMEKETGVNIPHKKAIDILQWFLSKEENAGVLETIRGLGETESVFAIAVKAMGERGRETERSPEWIMSPAGQRRLEALNRGRPKGAETRRSEAWQTTEGARRQREGGVKGKLTRQSAAYKSSEAGQRQLEGLKKGNETRKTEEWRASAAGQRSMAPEATKKMVQKASEKRMKKTDDRWDLFYRHHVVQALLQKPISQLDKLEKAKRKKLRKPKRTGTRDISYWSGIPYTKMESHTSSLVYGPSYLN